MIRAKVSALDETSAIGLSNCFVRDSKEYYALFATGSKREMGKNRSRLYQKWQKEIEEMGCKRTVKQIAARIKGDLTAVRKRISEDKIARKATGGGIYRPTKLDTARQILYEYLEGNWKDLQINVSSDTADSFQNLQDVPEEVYVPEKVYVQEETREPVQENNFIQDSIDVGECGETSSAYVDMNHNFDVFANGNIEEKNEPTDYTPRSLKNRYCASRDLRSHLLHIELQRAEETLKQAQKKNKILDQEHQLNERELSLHDVRMSRERQFLKNEEIRTAVLESQLSRERQFLRNEEFRTAVLESQLKESNLNIAKLELELDRCRNGK